MPLQQRHRKPDASAGPVAEKGEQRQREERKQARSEENAVKQEVLETVVAKPEVTALVPVSEAIQIVAAETDVVTEMPVQERAGDAGNEDETRRRRRRGGRNRAVGMPMPKHRPNRLECRIRMWKTLSPLLIPEVPVVDVPSVEVTEVTGENGSSDDADTVQVNPEEETASPRRESRRSHPRRRRVPAENAAVAAETDEVAVSAEKAMTSSQTFRLFRSFLKLKSCRPEQLKLWKPSSRKYSPLLWKRSHLSKK